MKNKQFGFLGTDSFSVTVLEGLKKNNLLPKIIITAPDREKNRGKKVLPPEAKIWASENNIKVIQPEKIDAEFLSEIQKENLDFFIVASYGKILPKSFLDLYPDKFFNVHPSLLPKHRGASPIESSILNDEKETGTTIILMNERMDAGPILKQEKVTFDEWPCADEVSTKLAELGAKLLFEIIEDFENIDAKEQDEKLATYTKKIEKENGLINWQDGARKNFLKIQAFNPWPSAFFFIKHHDKDIRIKITQASWDENKLVIEKVIPEGKSEMTFQDFLKGFKFNLDEINF